MAELPTSSGLSLFNWWYQPITEWQKTFMNMIHLEKTVAQMQMVEATQDMKNKVVQETQIFLGRNKEDQPVEQEIHGQVGSDGLQLGKMRKALDVLVSKLEDLTPEEQTVIDDFKRFNDHVQKILVQTRGPKPTDLTLGYCKRLVSALRQKEDEERHQFARDLRKLLKPFVNGDDGSPPAGRLADSPAVGKKR